MMDSTHWLIYILFLAIEVFATSFFMEFYKKSIRKNKSKSWENRAMGIVMSILCVLLLHFSNLIYPVFNRMFNAKIWLDYVLYLILFFIAQWKMDMIIIKKAVKTLVIQWIKDNANLNETQAEEVLKTLGI